MTDDRFLYGEVTLTFITTSSAPIVTFEQSGIRGFEILGSILSFYTSGSKKDNTFIISMTTSKQFDSRYTVTLFCTNSSGAGANIVKLFNYSDTPSITDIVTPL